MRVVVSDSSCLIDLRKASLLDALLRLPHEILIPNTLFEEELLRFTAEQKRELIEGGLKVMDLPGQMVLRAQEIARGFPHLSVHDGFAFALAESIKGCVLLTGDGRLRTLAEAHVMEVHGVLWVIDELEVNGVLPREDLLRALRQFEEDPTVRLPGRELTARIRRYAKS